MKAMRSMSTALVWVGVALVAIGIAVVGLADATEESAGVPTPQSSATPSAERGSTGSPVVEVYKEATCGCCTLWAAHLRDHGFTVRTHDVADMATVKATYGVPSQAGSCHTAVVEGYVIEGHVPAEDVERLLKERPAVAGLAVPGMPIGSPGMEITGVAAQPYDVLSFGEDGRTTVFASHR